MTAHFIGVDGGGTSARAVVVDDTGRVLGRAQGPGAVVTSTAPEAAVEATAHVVRDALSDAGVAGPATELWAGLAGAGRAFAREAAQNGLRRKGLADRVEVGTDVEAAFAAAFAEGPGVMLIAGTGSIARGRDARGETYRVGGWGAALGDEGSGFWVGRETLRLLLHMADGRAQGSTLLRAKILETLGLERAEDLIAWSETAEKSEVAALVPVVRGIAEAGDETADRLMERAADALAAHVTAMLGHSDDWPSPTPLALWGGLVARSDGAMHDRIMRRLESVDVEPRPGPIDPPLGAALLARRAHAARGAGSS